MMKKSIVIGALILLGSIGFLPTPAHAVSPVADSCSSAGASDSSICGGANDAIEPFIKAIVDWLLFLVGVLAVIMIVVGAIKYTLSAGDASKMTSAKNTIIYAVIGLIIGVLAYAIVNFVIDFGENPSGPSGSSGSNSNTSRGQQQNQESGGNSTGGSGSRSGGRNTNTAE